MIPAIANTLWLTSSLPESKRFHHATVQPEATQARLLKDYLRANQHTRYGRRFNFASINSVEDYQRLVPLTTYDDYVGDIERIANGESNILTAGPVQMFELSSGTTSASKFIPYTASLKAEFQRGLAPWIVNLFTHHPQLKNGPAYWSITPLAEGRRVTPGGIPVGFEEDSAYLGPLGAFVESALAVPNAVKHIQDVAVFRYLTLLFLLRESGLRLISVWNPTFLALLLAPLPDRWDQLLADIAKGTITPPGPLDPALSRLLQKKLRSDPRRARELASKDPGDLSRLWPHLNLISCWADGPSSPYAQQLAERFPAVPLQGKGLLATEAFVSFPLIRMASVRSDDFSRLSRNATEAATTKSSSVLAITSHFFEFLPAPAGSPDPAAQPRLAHQLEKSQTYTVVTTTGGGFYRYQLHDVVEVVDFANQTPCIRFVGKTDRISDRFGEKLHEQFVASALARIFSERCLSPRFAMLAPDDGDRCFRYTLYLELPPGQRADNLHHNLDQALSQNFHYAYCRKLGQLAEPHIALVVGGADAYLRACQQRGQKLGNIKPALLDKATGWDRWFEPTGKDNGSRE